MNRFNKMSFTKVELPSNKKFGIFFSAIFACSTLYFYLNDFLTLAYSSIVITVAFLCITIVKAEILFPLNYLWMHFGHLLGLIVRPIVLIVIFYGLLTPIAILMRLVGRDELGLKFDNKESHWTARDESTQKYFFENQF